VIHCAVLSVETKAVVAVETSGPTTDSYVRFHQGESEIVEPEAGKSLSRRFTAPDDGPTEATRGNLTAPTRRSDVRGPRQTGQGRDEGTGPKPRRGLSLHPQGRSNR